MGLPKRQTRRVPPPPPPPEPSNIQKAWPWLRGVILFFVGLALGVREALLTTEPRLALLGFYAAMMGLPFVLPGNRN